MAIPLDDDPGPVDPPTEPGFPIIASPSASKFTVLSNLPLRANPTFANEMVPALWAAALAYGIDPVGMVAQSGKETGWGHFEGRVRPWFRNTAGIKVRHVALVMGLLGTEDGDHPLVHQQFPSWTVGAEAHAQHLRAYAGQPVDGLIVDPRYTLVSAPFVTTWGELGGRWAPSSSYGTEIEAIMTTLRRA